MSLAEKLFFFCEGMVDKVEMGDLQLVRYVKILENFVKIYKNAWVYGKSLSILISYLQLHFEKDEFKLPTTQVVLEFISLLFSFSDKVCESLFKDNSSLLPLVVKLLRIPEAVFKSTMAYHNNHVQLSSQSSHNHQLPLCLFLLSNLSAM